jgi:DNA-nicking Smr family endonuclease
MIQKNNDEENKMKTSKSSGTFRPFKNLKELLESKSFKLAPSSVANYEKICSRAYSSRNKATKADDHKMDRASEDESEIFLEAMADVKPIQRGDRVESSSTASTQISDDSDSEDKALLELKKLVKFGKGFVVSDTPEYIEGTGYNVNPEFAKRLHRGDFSIQAYIDLHGLCVGDAQVAFERFLKDSVMTGKRAVLIVHGRGLSSPDKPVLKTKVVEWLTCGSWRKWVIAFSSARLHDGGAGATYVLLRQRPVTRAQRKKNAEKFPR